MDVGAGDPVYLGYRGVGIVVCPRHDDRCPCDCLRETAGHLFVLHVGVIGVGGGMVGDIVVGGCLVVVGSGGDFCLGSAS